MNYLLLVISIAAGVACTLLRNHLCKNSLQTKADFQLLNGVTSAFTLAFFIIFAIVTNTFSISWYTVILGIIFGALTTVAALMAMYALEIGPLSYTTIISKASMIIPALSGLVMFGESVGWRKYIGMALMLVSIFLSVRDRGGNRKSSLRWLSLCLVSAAATGMIGVMQKLHQSSDHRGELLAFLIVAFAMSTAYSLCTYAVLRSRGIGTTVKISPKHSFLWIALIIGVSVALANQINLYLSGVMASIIFFPVVNGAGLLIEVSVSVIFLRERFGFWRWAGIIAGCAAVALLCI